EQAGRPYLTMEWVDGGSLAETLNGRPQPARQSARWVSILARAVEHVHGAGIVHRDLKPGNILLSAPAKPQAAEIVPKIADFGIARLLDRPGTGAGRQWLGTPEYIAPELTGDGPGPEGVGPAADVYALGVILYEMLTGRPPFRAD